MARRIPWRLFLPVLQLALTATLLHWGNLQHHQLDEELVERAGGEVMVMVCLDCTPPATLAAALINVPVAILGPTEMFVWGHDDWQSREEVPVMACLVLLLWYWVGRQLDRRLGSLPPLEKPRFRIAATALYVLLLLISPLIGIGAQSMFHVGPFFFVVGWIWSFALVIHFTRRIVWTWQTPRSG